MGSPSPSTDMTMTHLRRAVIDRDTSQLASILHDDVIWNSCRGPDAVVTTFRSMLTEGASVTRFDAEHAGDRIIATIGASIDGPTFTAHLALLLDDGDLITHILDVADAAEAHSVVPRPAEGNPHAAAARFERVAPIFAVGDIEAAADHYRALGFKVEAYNGDAAYGFATRDGIEIHLSGDAGVDPLTTTSATYIWVNDAAALHAEWAASGRPGRFHEPEVTDYGLTEGAHVDPWGNLIRYGSPSS